MTIALEQSLSWPHAALLAAKLQFGLGVLAIPTTFRTLGVIPGAISLLIFSAASAYSSVDMQRIHAIHPDIDCLPTLHRHLFGPAGARVAAIICFIFTTTVVAAGLVTTSIALNAITSHAMCTAVFITLASVVILVIGVPLRQLQRVSWLGWLGFTCIAVAVYVLGIVLLLKRDVWWHNDICSPALLHSHASFDERMNALAIQLVCVCGNMAYYALLAEMRDRHTFTRAVFAGQTFVLLNNLTIGLGVALAAGQHLASPALSTAGHTIEKICYAIALPGLVVSALLYANLTAKQLYVKILRRREKPERRWWIWTFSMTVVVLCAFLIAQTVPIFDQIIGLIGACTGPWFVLIAPAYTRLYLVATKSGGSEKWSDGWKVRLTERLRHGRLGVRLEVSICFLIMLIGVVLTVMCTFSGLHTVLRFARATQHAHKPFACTDNSKT